RSDGLGIDLNSNVRHENGFLGALGMLRYCVLSSDPIFRASIFGTLAGGFESSPG
ncbi:hypothetical protein SARC_10160, partial [Sphaeroforma arctica JP610]